LQLKELSIPTPGEERLLAIPGGKRSKTKQFLWKVLNENWNYQRNGRVSGYFLEKCNTRFPHGVTRLILSMGHVNLGIK